MDHGHFDGIFVSGVLDKGIPVKAKLSTAIIAWMYLISSAYAGHDGIKIGAIRWDPWYIATDTAERPYLEASLGPSVYQGRSPSCATVTGLNTVRFDKCATQAQIDAEITAAHNAGLDYFAYVWYGSKDPMQTAWRFQQSSVIKDKINWCIIVSYSEFVKQVSESMEELISLLDQTNYQRVIVGRPILYLLRDHTSNMEAVRSSVQALRKAMSMAGRADPYIVLMGQGIKDRLAEEGADAMSDYQYAPPTNAGTHAELALATQARWETLAATGKEIIPTVTTGWDRRPRIERPVPWEKQQAGVGRDNFYVAGQPSEIANDVRAMLKWIKGHPTIDRAHTGLIYSWNEHDEGGSALAPEIGTGSAILAAVAGAL